MARSYGEIKIEILAHTELGPFYLVKGQWIDYRHQPAPSWMVPGLNEAHKDQSTEPSTKVYVDKGDSL